MGQFWMDNYARRVIKIAHERGALAIGGLSTLVPDVSASYLEVQKRSYLKRKSMSIVLGMMALGFSHEFFGKIAFKDI